MASEPKLAVRKKGEHVKSNEHEGIFEAVFVNALIQTANIRLVDGTAHVVPNVPWSSLKTLVKK